jgi:hypothetical protein
LEAQAVLGLILVLLALWLACEICLYDITQPPPPDPYRADRWKSRGTR